MLKIVFWLLLLANAALLAYQGFTGSQPGSGREPARMGNQLNADKIRLIPPGAAAAPVAAPGSTQAAAAQPAATPSTATPSAATQTTAPQPAVAISKLETAACNEIGNFSAEEAKRLEARLASLPLGDRVSSHPVKEVLTHMVYIPSQGDKEGAERKAGELRRLGITDYFIIQDSSSVRWGISLGVFRNEEAARAHLANLMQKGVRTARIGHRNVTATMVAFQLKGLDADMRAAVEKIIGEFPKHEVRECGEV